MTVVAWDGVSMAADRWGEYYTTKTRRTKIKRVGPNLVGCAGAVYASEQVLKWFEAGADPERYPKIPETDAISVLVTGPDGLRLYEKGPHPMWLENKFFAIGSGGDAAMAAMYLGCPARRAVEVACEVATSCGGGVDVLTLKETK